MYHGRHFPAGRIEKINELIKLFGQSEKFWRVTHNELKGEALHVGYMSEYPSL